MSESSPPPSKRVGIEWVNNYDSVGLPVLSNSGYNAQGFRNRIVASGTGIAGYERGDNSPGGRAQATDIEQDLSATTASRDSAPDTPTAARGADADIAETVDILYFSGHGTIDRLFFAGDTQDDREAWNTEMRLGENGLKWFVADACSVLNTTYGHFNADGSFFEGGVDARFRWRLIFRGLRYLFGFHGICADVHNRGEFFANQLNSNLPNNTIEIAWKIACEESEEYAAWAYLRAGNDASAVQNDKWRDTVFLPPGPGFTYSRNRPPKIPSTTSIT